MLNGRMWNGFEEEGNDEEEGEESAKAGFSVKGSGDGQPSGRFLPNYQRH